jgi:hypothetical protein
MKLNQVKSDHASVFVSLFLLRVNTELISVDFFLTRKLRPRTTNPMSMPNRSGAAHGQTALVARTGLIFHKTISVVSLPAHCLHKNTIETTALHTYTVSRSIVLEIKMQTHRTLATTAFDSILLLFHVRTWHCLILINVFLILFSAPFPE